MKNLDPKDYYASLQVSPQATAQEIKAAYRKLAKLYHPDSTGDSRSKARFEAVHNAYLVLSDPDRRAAYDRAAYDFAATTPRSGNIPRTDPLCCSKCGKVTAQPRYVVFRHVISFIVVTVTTAVQGIYCSKCARKVGFRASGISAIAGWWGLPWGPISTVTNIFRNALGGARQRDSEEKLLWYNTLAFLSSGNLPLAYALARRLRTTKNETLALDAVRLIDYLRAMGVSEKSAELRDSWRPRGFDLLVHLALVLLTPTLFWFYSLQDSPGNATSANRNSFPVAEEMNTNQSISPNDKVSPMSFETISVDWDALKPTCTNTPVNGQVLAGAAKAFPYEGHKLEIRNGSNAHAIIKAREALSDRLIISFFVEKGSTASFDRLPDGRYKFQYAFGRELAEDCRSFTRIEAAQRMPESEQLVTRVTSTQIVRSHLMYTLYVVPGGNVRPQYLDPVAFNRD